MQAALRDESDAVHERSTAHQHAIVAVAAEGAVRHLLRVIRFDARGPAGVVLEGAAGEGDDAAGGAEEGIVAGSVAVAGEERVADDDAAVGDVETKVGVIVIHVAQGTLLQPQFAADDVAGDDIAAGVVALHGVVLPAVAHGDVPQMARPPVEHQPRPLIAPAVRRRGERDRPRRCPYRHQMPHHLQLHVAASFYDDARLHRQGDAGRDDRIRSQYVRAAGQCPGSIRDDSAANVGEQGDARQRGQTGDFGLRIVDCGFLILEEETRETWNGERQTPCGIRR